MQRRKFVVGLGALASGSAAAVGTGAFTSVTADRSVTVSVTGDQSAYLGMDAEASTNGAYADESGDDGELSIDFGDISSSSRDNTQTDGGSGVNPNAVTEAKDVFRITNQGTQAVEVDIASDSDTSGTSINTSNPSDATAGSDAIYIYFNKDTSSSATSIASGNDGNILSGSDDDIELAPGDVVQVDVVVTTGTGDTQFNSGNGVQDLTVSADAGDVNDTADAGDVNDTPD
ncbi:hypothetical protein PM025_14585 [Halorubrum ezzemoulense]|uniref:hypothetical protein n=1 Tax=Halorubrum ezzemoulense TaxID=337243 RepID=UPI00232C1722|nr:hypothetical protein [Halorubrum ezzemoulense]MDB2265344.1 hypothetical protein [Halorubrum ezzemoulense]